MKKMNILSQKIICFNEVLEITNQRVLYWESFNSIILSDLHIGKSAHFQKSGIPIPSSVLQNDLNRLQKLIDHFKVNRLIIVGDLFHAEYNSDLDIFKSWLNNFKTLKIDLIKGNHDRLHLSIYKSFNIQVFNTKLEIGNLKFVHDFITEDKNLFTISGHIHPGVFIKGKARQQIKLPCFQITKSQLILPAFSLFTGLNTRNKPSSEYINYAFTEDGIYEI